MLFRSHNADRVGEPDADPVGHSAAGSEELFRGVFQSVPALFVATNATTQGTEGTVKKGEEWVAVTRARLACVDDARRGKTVRVTMKRT
jgi:hypothetical protein